MFLALAATASDRPHRTNVLSNSFRNCQYSQLALVNYHHDNWQIQAKASYQTTTNQCNPSSN